MKKINSRQKGAAGERELATYLKDKGYADARRGQQFHGGADSPDVVCPGITEEFHLEVKRVEAGNPYVWMDQAIRDAVHKTPIVVHRKNKRDWLVVMRLDDFLNMNLLRGIPDVKAPAKTKSRTP